MAAQSHQAALALALFLVVLSSGASQAQPARDASASPKPSPSPSPSPAASPSPSPASGGGTASSPSPPATGGGLKQANTRGRAVSDATAVPVIPIEEPNGWRLARATYYSAPKQVVQAYDPTRGEGSFGILAYGSCGFTNSDGTIPFPQDAVAAAADADPDYPGSCGRCYAVRCKTGIILDNDQKPLDIYAPYNTYLPGINNKVKDTFGRSWPGNPVERNSQQLTRCWNNTKNGNGTSDTLVMRIIDSCPCKQVLPAGAPGVAPGGEVRTQHWCCGGMQHFDLSYAAFEQLAHPVYGQMMLEYQPVECPADFKGGPVDPSTLKPLAFSPGHISKTVVYGPAGTAPGWGWMPYFAKDAFWRVPGAGVKSDEGATCIQLTPGGGLSFRCRQCSTPGYQPLSNASALEIVVRPNSNSTDPYFSSTPQDQVPPLKVYLQNEAGKKFCNGEVFLNATKPDSSASGPRDSRFYTFKIPLSRFRCDYEGAMLPDIDNISVENASPRQGFVCIARVAILHDGRGSGGGDGASGGPEGSHSTADAAKPPPASGRARSDSSNSTGRA